MPSGFCGIFSITCHTIWGLVSISSGLRHPITRRCSPFPSALCNATFRDEFEDGTYFWMLFNRIHVPWSHILDWMLHMCHIFGDPKFEFRGGAMVTLNSRVSSLWVTSSKFRDKRRYCCELVTLFSLEFRTQWCVAACEAEVGTYSGNWPTGTDKLVLFPSIFLNLTYSISEILLNGPAWWSYKVRQTRVIKVQSSIRSSPNFKLGSSTSNSIQQNIIQFNPEKVQLVVNER